MDELRVVRREEGSLILANELGEEYRLTVDEEVAQEIRQATRRSASSVRVRPREIQALLRAGKSRSQVAAETGLEEADVERFEEPVRAEQRYMLELAHDVTVRTDPSQSSTTPTANEDEQRFGQVISERLIGLGNTASTWRSWRDEETGWLIGLAFDSREGEHDAVWSFDHKKRVLSPLTPDATNLSKLGDVGDRLIPKLRAVDNEQRERFDSGTFDPDGLLAPTAEIEPLADGDAGQGNGRGGASDEAPGDATEPVTLSADAEYERRREIDHLAVKTPDTGEEDLSQTADLLDALRRRRGERSLETELPIDDAQDELPAPSGDATAGATLRGIIDPGPSPKPGKRTGAAANIWGTSGVSATPDDAQGGRTTPETRTGSPSAGSDAEDAAPAQVRTLRSHLTGAGRTAGAAAGGTAASDSARSDSAASDSAGADAAAQDAASDTADTASAGDKRGIGKREAKRGDSKRGRSSIPSWDDILFGTRSDDDPA